jgi:hypothetical protein
MPKFQAVLESRENEQKRYVSLSKVPCHECDGDPLKARYCHACHGSRDEPATQKTARAFLERMEQEYVEFRLDEQRTHDRYPQSLGAMFASPEEALPRIQETGHVFHEQDAHLIDGRFVRAGKATGPQKLFKGWLALHHQSEPYKVVQLGQVDEDGPSAVVTAGQFGVPIKNLLSGANVWDWDTDTIKVALTTSTFVPDIDVHDFFNDVTNEITGTGYTAGGATLASPTLTYDTASDQIRLDAADTTWTTSTLTARIAIGYKSTGTASTSPLIFFVNFGADVSTTAGTFQITWDATGIFIIDVT